MKADDIVPLIKRTIPTIVSFDAESRVSIIGDDARRMGLRGKTTVFNFKPLLGQGDKEFSRDKKFWYWVPAVDGTAEHLETFTAKEATQRFLQTLLAQIKVPGKVIIGEPAIREQAWKENFRRHVREVFLELGLADPIFFPEPFAVFQYYRHIEKSFPVTDHPEIVLIIDIGGGTFNSCVIRTTEQGLLARGGATAVPLGLQAGVCGGTEVDRELLKRVINKCHAQKVRWKDDPIQRVNLSHQEALLRIEDAKIQLSDAIATHERVELITDYSHIKKTLRFPAGELHPDQDLTAELDGEDLKSVIREMWRRHYGKIIIETINEARKALHSALGLPLEKIDRVLVAGGSSRLPFMKQEIQAVLPSLVDPNHIYIGSDIGESVAFGIALECREQAKRDSQLSVDKLASCMTSDLYIGFRKSRRGQLEVPRVRSNGELANNGQLLSAPFETEESTRSYELELPFDPEDRLLYFFSDTPFRNDSPSDHLNITHDILSLPPMTRVSRKCTLTLSMRPDGFIKPAFHFRGKGNSQNKTGEVLECPEFYSQGFQIKEGATYLGLDFGTSNSYVVKFVSVPKASTGHKYPVFTMGRGVTAKLREIELKLLALREAGRLGADILASHARDKMLEIVFHSNKIEGNTLTKGETERVLAADAHRIQLSTAEREAKNLESAYRWMVEHSQACSESPELFIRQLNKIVLGDLNLAGGMYRTGPVSISGIEFSPPPAASVSAFMREMSEEMRNDMRGRSPLECAAAFHTKLVFIHPFADGNGRTARLLMNALLLSRGLPVVVINYADRERYLECLKESNGGDLTALVEFTIECFNEQLVEFQPATDESGEGLTTKPSVVTETADDAINPINVALEAVGVGEADDPLTAVLESKALERRKHIAVEFEAWKQSILVVPAELSAIASEVNCREIGCQLRLHHYDLLTFDKYADIAGGKSVTKTWFVGVDITSSDAREKLIFFFNGASWNLKRKGSASSVSLAVSRFDGTRFARLSLEPIGLREIGYSKGTLMFVSRDGSVHEGDVRRNLRAFVADLIKTYL